jgi:F-type H+-transporting ATPase subunit b
VSFVAALVGAEDPARTHHWLLPETAEIIYGGLASVVIIGALVKFAGPAVKKGMAARTARIQSELDRAAAAKSSAETESTRIRAAKGDIESERARLLAEADAQAEAVLAEGRARLEREVVDLEAKATADIAGLGTRSGDELRAEIARLSAAAVDEVVARSLDDATQQQLIESFIQHVGVAR